MALNSDSDNFGQFFSTLWELQFDFIVLYLALPLSSWRNMVRIQLVKYWKRYLRKGRYRCKRYFFYVPVAVGERVDRSVEYLVRLFGPLIVLVPEGMELSLSMLEKLEKGSRGNHHRFATLATNSLQEN